MRVLRFQFLGHAVAFGHVDRRQAVVFSAAFGQGALLKLTDRAALELDKITVALFFSLRSDLRRKAVCVGEKVSCQFTAYRVHFEIG